MQTKSSSQVLLHFAGFDDWFEVFRTGEQTDSQGRKKTFTTDDLDSMVANHDATQPAPLVVGHPKTDDPAYGWTEGLKRDGELLLAKARPTVPAFEEAVKNEIYPNRSVSITPTDNGWKLKHIGFLGAAAPAVEGMPRLQFSTDPNAHTFEFSLSEDDAQPIKNVLRDIGSFMRSVREWWIEKHSREEADELVPDWQLDHLGRQIDRIGQQSDRLNNYAQPGGNKFEQEGFAMNEKEQMQAEIDALKQKNQQLESSFSTADAERKRMQYQSAVSQAKAQVDALVKEGKLLPAQAVGLAEFMANLASGEDANFEFSQPAAKDGEQPTTAKVTPEKFFSEFLSKLGKQIELGKRDDDAPREGGHNYEAPAGTVVSADRAELHEKALQYQADHKCDYITAVQAVERGQ